MLPASRLGKIRTFALPSIGPVSYTHLPYGVMDITTQIQLRNYMATVKVEHDNQLEAAFEHFGMNLPEE